MAIPTYFLIAAGISLTITIICSLKGYIHGSVITFAIISLPAFMEFEGTKYMEFDTIIGWALLLSIISLFLSLLIKTGIYSSSP